MKPLKPLLIFAGLVFLFVALSLLAKDVKKPGLAVLETILPQAILPVLKIDGKETQLLLATPWFLKTKPTAF